MLKWAITKLFIFGNMLWLIWQRTVYALKSNEVLLEPNYAQGGLG